MNSCYGYVYVYLLAGGQFHMKFSQVSNYFVLKMELHRVDYTILGLTSKKCMKLLPSTASKYTQKVVVGDQEGITQIFYIKKGEIQITFKSLPYAPVSNIVLGGSIGTTQDKIFVSSENIVRGLTKKGKIFLNFETQLLETIKCMYVCGNDLIVSGVHNYHHYHDCKLVDSYTCSDIINDIITLNVAKVRRLTAVLACADQILRVLDGSAVTQSLALPNSPTALHLMNGDGGSTGDHVLVGMQEGQIYLVQITRSNSTIIKWILENENRKSEVTCMTSFDLMKTGIPDIIIGRHDGNIEVYTVIQHDEVSNEFKPPVEKFCYSGNESITSIQCGFVGNVHFEEVIVTTYTGWLFGLTTEVPEKQVTNDANDLNYGFSREEKQKILKLKSEIEELEVRIAKEREKYLAFTQEDSAAISRLPYLTINDKMMLQKDDATYFVMLESETNIDNILIQSDIPIKLLDVDKNSAVVSYSKCDSESGNAVLATYRCQLNTVRLELKFYVDEGQKGTLQAYVTPLTQPKCCQVRKYPIKPLALHCRVHTTTETERFNNSLQLKGTFSVAEMHTWVTQCLPELPEKPPDEEKITYTFKSALLDTVLECLYSRGEAEFKSDNISTISILRDILSKEATKKKIKLEISSTTNEQSVITTLQSLNVKLEKYYKLHQQSMLLDALKDIDAAQPEPLQNNLIQEYKDILEKEKEIQTQLKQRPFYLERLQSAVLNLFLDWHKFKGINIKPKLAAFNNTLKNNYSYQEICSYFSL